MRYGYPEGVIRRAEQSAAWLLATVQAGAEPFGIGYRRWLERLSPDIVETGVGAAAAAEATDGQRPIVRSADTAVGEA